MHSKEKQQPTAVRWTQFRRQGYSAFASLGRVICIGVLSASTLAIAAKAEATVERRTTDNGMQATDAEHEEELEELTVTGTMAPLTQLQSARVVTVISRADVERAGVQSVNDLFKLATGVDVRQRGGFGIQTDISIDGGTFDQMTLLLNGVNISNPHTGHLAADLPVSISDIERIEVLEGAASRVYGATAFGGAINIVTRRESENSLTLGAQGGSFGTFDADARTAYRWRNLSNRLSGGGGRSDGGTTNSQWRKGQFFYQGDFAHELFSLNWQAGMSRKAYGANTFYSPAWPNQYERNERYLISVGAETNGRFRLTPSIYWNRTYDNFELVRGERFGENFHQADVYGLRLGGHISWLAGRTAVAAELRQEDILSTSLGRDLEEQEYRHVRHHSDIDYTRRDNRTNISYSAEHNILLDHWTISAGLTAHQTTSLSRRFRLYPGADIAYRPNRDWKLSLSYNKGFRLPTFTDLYYQSPTHNGNRDLRPEENHSTQLALQYSHSGLQATLRGFYHRGHSMIDWVMYTPDDTYHSANFNLDNLGFQTQLRLELRQLTGRDTWVEHIDAGYTFMHQKRRDHTPVWKSNYAMEYLRHKLVVRLSHRIWNDLSASWSLRWQDRMGSYIRFDQTYTDPTTGYERGQSSGTLAAYHPYATLDLKLQWTKPRYVLFLQATNLTDHRYYDLGNIPQPGLWVMAGARLKLSLH